MGPCCGSELRARGTAGERVRNGDLWVVERAHRDGSLSVRHLEHRGRVRLPADYVRESCGLGYATTIHRAQGMTVDAAHVLVDDTMNRQALYVALTRGRDTIDTATGVPVRWQRRIEPPVAYKEQRPRRVDMNGPRLFSNEHPQHGI